MLIKSPALEKVLRLFGSEEKISQITHNLGKDVRSILLECGIPIGYLRWVSLQEELDLKFEDLEFSAFISKDTFILDQSKFIQVVKNKSQKQNIPDEQLKASIQNIRNDTHDPWHICCGHDLVDILSLGLRRAFGTQNINDIRRDLLEKDLILAYERLHFKKTQLYLSIQQWEMNNKPFTILVKES